MKIKKYKGKSKGLKVLLIAGVHGNEITPQTLLSQHNELKDLAYDFFHITTAIVENPNRTREIHVDINRSLGQTSQIDELTQLIETHDVVVDIHTSANCLTMLLFDSNRTDDLSYNLLKTLSKYVDCATWKGSGKTIKDFVLNKGKIGLTIELDGGFDCTDYYCVADHVSFLANTLETINQNYYQIIDHKETKKKIKGVRYIKAKRDGIILSLVNSEQSDVRKGKIIGKLNSSVVIAPCTGTIIAFPSSSNVNKGDCLFMIQPELNL
jgi:predicted deacylase